ncbi:BCL2 associated agonist of cell death b [Esox lucius]|nr:BCL2 associated agonist of cell death b [Esox lucius]
MENIFTISDTESESSDVEETKKEWIAGQGKTGSRLGLSLNLPGEGRIRLNSESQVFATSGGERSGELQGLGQGLNCVATEGLPFRVRSQSAPPALWAAKRYGRQLRRMSDEFDTWLDKGQMKRVKSAGAAKQMTTSPSWWAFLFSHKETETEKTPNLIITEPRSSE